MGQVDAIEGIVDDVLWYHDDLVKDVLYLRLVRCRDIVCFGEETNDGTIVLRREDNDEVACMTVVGWWKRFGQGALPDSLRTIQDAIEPRTQRVAA